MIAHQEGELAEQKFRSSTTQEHSAQQEQNRNVTSTIDKILSWFW